MQVSRDNVEKIGSKVVLKQDAVLGVTHLRRSGSKVAPPGHV